MRRIGWWLTVMLMVFSLVSGVRAQDLDPNSDPAALMRFVHALPDAPAVDIFLDDEKIVDDLSPGDATDYGFARDGEQQVVVRAGDADADAEPLLEQTVDLSSGASYTLAVAGDPDQSDAFLLTDEVGASGEEFGSLRVVNLVPGDAPLAAAVDGAAITELLPYGESSERVFADQATPEVTIFDEGGNELVTAPDLSLGEGEFYTLFVVPNEEDEAEVLAVLYPILTGALPDYQIWVPLMTQGDEAPLVLEAAPTPEATSEMQDVGQMLLERVQATATAEAQATAQAQPITATEATTSTDVVTRTEPVTDTSLLMPVTGAEQKDGPIPLWLVLDGLLLIMLVFVGRFWWHVRAQ